MQLIFNISISLIFLLTTFCYSFSQKDGKTYADCEGTINIFKTNTYDLQFIGNRGKSNRFSQYQALSHLTSGNQIWFSFIAPTDGRVALDLESESAGLTLVVFDDSGGDVCTEITRGDAEIKRLVVPQKSTKIGLSEEISDSYLYPAPIFEGKVLHFVVIADNDISERVHLDFRFISDEPSFSEYEAREMNFKKDDFSPSLVFQIRDKETGNPLVSRLVLRGIKFYEGMYNVSDLIFDASRSGKLEYSCEHEGYFFRDSSNISISANQENIILIELESVRPGKSMQMEDIEFVPGTSQIAENSIPKLKRLKDFLALNSMINIEIQGHVYEPGSNSFSGQKMSEARANRIMKYLSDNGISKERMTAVGYGNKHPVYKNPKNHNEEQANRRVEVVIK